MIEGLNLVRVAFTDGTIKLTVPHEKKGDFAIIKSNIGTWIIVDAVGDAWINPSDDLPIDEVEMLLDVIQSYGNDEDAKRWNKAASSALLKYRSRSR